MTDLELKWKYSILPVCPFFLFPFYCFLSACLCFINRSHKLSCSGWAEWESCLCIETAACCQNLCWAETSWRCKFLHCEKRELSCQILPSVLSPHREVLRHAELWVRCTGKTKPWQREGARDSLDCDTLLPWETRRLLGQVLPWYLQEAWWTSKFPGGFLKMWLWILFIQVTVYIQHMLATWNLSQPLSLGVLFTCLQH